MENLDALRQAVAVSPENVPLLNLLAAACLKAGLGEEAQTHFARVLELDPSQIEGGPGKGYGVKRAAEGIIRHIEMAGADDAASENVSLHSTHVASAARNTAARADRIVALAAEIMAAGSADVAAPLMEELASLSEQLTAGVDANGDGRMGWQEGEGGLSTSETHMNLMKRGEGMGG